MLIVAKTTATVAAQASLQRAPKEVAKEYVDAGVAAQKNGDYAIAINLYEKANTLAPHPVLLFNIAQAHRLAATALRTSDPKAAAEHRDRAREIYRKFLDTKPDGDLEVMAQGWLSKLDQEWAAEFPKEEAARRAEEDAKREAAIAAEQKRLDEERRKAEARNELEKQRISAAVSSSELESAKSKSRTIKIVGIAALGVGAASVATGAYFGLHARQLSSQLTRTDVYDQGLIDKGHQGERYMAIAYAAGATLILGGVVTYWIGHEISARADEAPRATVSLVSGGGAAVVLSGGF